MQDEDKKQSRIEMLETIITFTVVFAIAVAFLLLKVYMPEMFPKSSDIFPFIVILS